MMWLAQAPNPDALIKTHKKAHGLNPVSVEKFKQGRLQINDLIKKTIRPCL
jgi:hypothetical protein